jgi:hypothetical protein
MEHWWNATHMGKQKYLDKILSQFHPYWFIIASKYLHFYKKYGCCSLNCTVSHTAESSMYQQSLACVPYI